MRTIADLRRAMSVGSVWHVQNNLHPHVTGQRIITKGKTVKHYSGTKADGSTFVNGRFELPKTADVEFDGDSIHFLNVPGLEPRIAYTWTLVQA